jgi:hypothetical protein
MLVLIVSLDVSRNLLPFLLLATASPAADDRMTTGYDRRPELKDRESGRVHLVAWIRYPAVLAG